MSKAKTTAVHAADRQNDGAGAATQRICTICFVTYPTRNVLALRRCEHMMCRDCLTRYCESASRNESLFPVKCCRMPVEVQDAERYIPGQIAKQYKAKTLQYSTKDRTYCHVQKCSAFISAYSVYDQQAICPKCSASTCVRCKCAWHYDACISTEDAHLMQLARRMKWEQCPSCHYLIERTEGCDNMTCRCGSEFCYGCGYQQDDCKCEEDEGDDGDEMLCIAVFD